MSAVANSRLTHEQFFALCERSDERYEYVAGEVLAMARGSYNHASLITRLGAHIYGATKGPCQSFTDSISVYIDSADAIRTPDVVVACPPNVIDARQGLIDNPALLIEVTSPSTRGSDHSEKLREYASLDSTRHYILVDSEAMHVEMFSRHEDATRAEGTWGFQILTRPEETLTIPMLGLTLSLAEIYEGLAFDPADASTDPL